QILIVALFTVGAATAAATAEGRISYQDPPRYQFRYTIKDSSEHFGHSEVRDLGRTEGEYFVKLPDGRMKTVTYVADDSGYHPKVVYKNSETEQNSYSPKPEGSSKSHSRPEKLKPRYNNDVPIKSINSPYRPDRYKNSGYKPFRTTSKPLTIPTFPHRLSKPAYTTAIPTAKPSTPNRVRRPKYITTPIPSYTTPRTSYLPYQPKRVPYTSTISHESGPSNNSPEFRKFSKSSNQYGDRNIPIYSQIPSYPSATKPFPNKLVPIFHVEKDLFLPAPHSPSLSHPFPQTPQIYEPTPDQFYHPQKPFHFNPSLFTPLPSLSPSQLHHPSYDPIGPSVVARVVAVPIPIEKHNELKPLRHYQLEDINHKSRSLSNSRSNRKSNVAKSSSSTRKSPSTTRNQQVNNVRTSALVRNNAAIRITKTIEDEIEEYDEAAEAYI
ncbi:unnamed protein product, partial [Meganyctiphanes norvegica]